MRVAEAVKWGANRVAACVTLTAAVVLAAGSLFGLYLSARVIGGGRGWVGALLSLVCLLNLPWAGLLFFYGARSLRRGFFKLGPDRPITSPGRARVYCLRLPDEDYEALRVALPSWAYVLERGGDVADAKQSQVCVVGEWPSGEEWQSLREGWTQLLFFVGEKDEIERRRGDYVGASWFVPAGSGAEAAERVRFFAPSLPI